MIDVLVIGSGGAGLTAALHAKEQGVEVTIVTKGYPTHAQTSQAQGGINAVLNESEESIQKHIQDTIKSAHSLANKECVEILCRESKNSIEWLNSIGVPFSRDENNNIAQRKFGASSEDRTCYSSDYTGLKILHTLYDQTLKEDINYLNEHLLLELIVQGNKVIGAMLLNIQTGETKTVYAKTMILATGGYSNIYNGHTTNSVQTTGDGIIAAYQAGAKLSNLEFVQFHPTSMAKNSILISESARGEGAYIIDEEGNRFVNELSQRDVVARAIQEKIENGSKVYLDMRHIEKEKILEFMPQEYRLAREFCDIELDKDLLEIKPAAHYCMGGIKTNVSCETSIENLYAVGECAQNSLHGANRIGGNSLQEIITFGKIAGKNAAKKSQETELSEETFENCESKLTEIFKRENLENFYKKREEIGELFIKKVGLFRDKKSLEEAQEIIEQTKNSINHFGLVDRSTIYNKNLVELIEFENMVNLAELTLISALKREESRGSHYRSDHEKESESLDKNSLILLENNEIKHTFEEIE